MKTRSILVGIMISAFFAISCNAQQSNNRQKKQEPPTFAQLLKEMDANEDGKLAKSEIKGPLKDGFDKVDTDEDGFITEKEFKKAPKPDGKRPPKRDNK